MPPSPSSTYTRMEAPSPVNSHRIAAWVLAGVALFVILHFGLLVSALAGLLVFHLTHALAPFIERRITPQGPRLIAVTVVSMLIIGLLTLGIAALVGYFRSDAGSLQALLDRLMGMIDDSRGQIPDWLLAYLPEDSSDMRRALGEWLADHRAELSLVGAEAVQTIVRLLIGMVLGAMIALYDELPSQYLGPLGRELAGRASRFADAFKRIVFAQLKISLLNTFFTGLFLAVVLPAFGVHLPLTKTLIVITFVAGLLPVVGNLISNTVITIVGLSVSFYVAVAALAYLILIHKVEYFLNARIVGGEIHARAWELLLAMLTMEAIFGIPGLVAAPVYYAYIKRELTDQGWI
jgi:predicted PurR-regulated permease PerM